MWPKAEQKIVEVHHNNHYYFVALKMKGLNGARIEWLGPSAMERPKFA